MAARGLRRRPGAGSRVSDRTTPGFASGAASVCGGGVERRGWQPRQRGLRVNRRVGGGLGHGWARRAASARGGRPRRPGRRIAGRSEWATATGGRWGGTLGGSGHQRDTWPADRGRSGRRRGRGRRGPTLAAGSRRREPRGPRRRRALGSTCASRRAAARTGRQRRRRAPEWRPRRRLGATAVGRSAGGPAPPAVGRIARGLFEVNRRHVVETPSTSTTGAATAGSGASIGGTGAAGVGRRPTPRAATGVSACAGSAKGTGSAANGSAGGAGSALATPRRDRLGCGRLPPRRRPQRSGSSGCARHDP